MSDVGLKKKDRPVADMRGVSGNTMFIMGRASSLLKRAGLREKADEMCQRVVAAISYDDALRIIMEYVDIRL